MLPPLPKCYSWTFPPVTAVAADPPACGVGPVVAKHPRRPGRRQGPARGPLSGPADTGHCQLVLALVTGYRRDPRTPDLWRPATTPSDHVEQIWSSRAAMGWSSWSRRHLPQRIPQHRYSRSAQNSLGSRHPERGRGNSFHSKPYYTSASALNNWHPPQCSSLGYPERDLRRRLPARPDESRASERKHRLNPAWPQYCSL
mmetsp:Transcript_75473/g.166740  ORF Transcript_75473/g.166740 Transcript_75473/m.166740 type:complete len:200 (-) Transcript_75473:35-634(-)